MQLFLPASNARRILHADFNFSGKERERQRREKLYSKRAGKEWTAETDQL